MNPSSKNIALCADGTGNANIRGRGSNVFKLFEAIDTASRSRNGRPRQIAFYDEGVGSEDFLPRRLLGGAVGWGLATNVCELYTELARVYVPGDRIYLFGFSRGAFTVRTLAQMIQDVGIVDSTTFTTAAELWAAATFSYRSFIAAHQRSLKPALQSNDALSVPAQHNPYSYHSAHEHLIPCLGAWDTVDAVGFSIKEVAQRANVFRPFKCDVSHLPRCVGHAYHALALDDQRHAFWPELWKEDADRVTEVWFAGVHSDIGGGYERQGLSLITLHWMIKCAEATGLTFNPRDVQFCADHQNSADKLHDSRQGIGLYYRWMPRERLFEAPRQVAHVHISVFERAAQGVDGYSPSNLPVASELRITDAASAAMETGVLTVLGRYDSDRTQAGRDARSIILTGVRSYRAFVLGTLFGMLALASSIGALATTASQAFGFEGDTTPTFLVLALILMAIAVCLLLYARVASLGTDRSVDTLHTSLWQRMRSELQAELGLR